MLLSPKKYLSKVLFLTILLRGFVDCVSVNAATDSVTNLSDQAKNAISDKQDQLDAINAKIKAYQQIIDLKQRQGATLSDQLQLLQAQADKLQAEINLNTQKISDLEEQIAVLANRINEKESLISNQKKVLSELMRTYYDDYTSISLLPGIFAVGENILNMKQGDWTAEVGDKVRDLLDSIQKLRTSLTEEQASLVNKKIDADSLRVQLSERNSYLQSAKNSKVQLLSKTQAEITKYNNTVDDLKKHQDEIEQEIEDLEANKVSELDLSDIPVFKNNLFIYPVKKVTISQKYGKTSYSKHYVSGKHNGVDFAIPSGSIVYAAFGGKVISIGNNGRYAYGKWVAINHGNGLVTLYGHMSYQAVSKGEQVKQGEKIGFSGNTGYSTGPHVHFSVFSEKSFELVESKIVKGLMIPVGATVNPMVYLPS